MKTPEEIARDIVDKIAQLDSDGGNYDEIKPIIADAIRAEREIHSQTGLCIHGYNPANCQHCEFEFEYSKRTKTDRLYGFGLVNNGKAEFIFHERFEGLKSELRAVLCDPEGNVVIDGSPEDIAIIQRLLTKDDSK